MNLQAVQAQIGDLPATFRSSGWSTQMMSAVAAAMALFTGGDDATMAQVSKFSVAQDNWIDLWGLLFNVPRNNSEGSIPYALRVQRTVTAWVGTLPAIQQWLNWFAPGGTVAESVSGFGYVLTLPQYMTSAQITAFLVSLGSIRPAGVPFTVQQQGVGLFAGTEGFLGDGQALGSYLAGIASPYVLGLGAYTPNSPPLIPTILLTDPSLNPSLAGVAL